MSEILGMEKTCYKCQAAAPGCILPGHPSLSVLFPTGLPDRCMLFFPNPTTSNLGTLKEMKDMNQNYLTEFLRQQMSQHSHISHVGERRKGSELDVLQKHTCPSTEGGLLYVLHHFNMAQQV